MWPRLIWNDKILLVLLYVIVNCYKRMHSRLKIRMFVDINLFIVCCVLISEHNICWIYVQKHNNNNNINMMTYLFLWFCNFLDNPNYFDVENGLTSPKTPTENRGSGFFIFRKRTSSSNKQSPKSAIGNYNNVDTSVLGKRRGSLKNLLRSRSNSASINKPQVITIIVKFISNIDFHLKIHSINRTIII